MTQLVTCNTIQEENDSHTGKQGTGTRQNVVFSGTYSCNKNGENVRIAWAQNPPKQN